MIQLPANYLDSAYIDNLKGVVYLHFKNSADQYFTYRFQLDKAFSFEQNLERLAAMDLSTKQAYRLNSDLAVIFVDQPNDQNWLPAPLPGDNILSFAQYKAHAQMAAHEDHAAKQQGQNAQ